MQTPPSRAGGTTARFVAPGTLGTVVAASFGFALVQLDVTVVNVALPPMGAALGAPVSALQWVVDAYTLAFAALLLSAGHLGDRFGARRIYIGGFALFAAASAACGAAPDLAVLAGARAVQGLAAAAMLPCSLALLNHATAHDARLRAKAVGWWTAAGSITIAAGPIVGGLLLGAFGWRSIFLVNLPVCALGAALALRLPEAPRHPPSRGFDLAGQALSALALAAVAMAVIEWRPLGPADPRVWGALLLGLACGLGFARVESRSARPMIPPGLFRHPVFRACLAYGIVVNFTYYGMMFVLSLYLQRVLGLAPVQAGLAFLPLTATFFAVNLLSGWWVARAGSRAPMVSGALIDAAGFACMCALGAHSPVWLMLPMFALLPAGMGLGVPAMTTAVLASVDRRSSGVVGGVLNAARQAGGAMGVAVFGALCSGGDAQIPAGLHACALIAAALLLLAAAWAARAVRPAQPRGAEAAPAAAQPEQGP